MRDVDLDVAPGERRAILGPNGAGKTTLFNVISGDMPATSGTIEFLGQDIGAVSRAADARGWAWGAPTRSPASSSASRVEDNLYLAVLGTRGGPPAPVGAQGATARCASAPASWPRTSASSAKLPELVGSISHGEQRQLEVAMARATEPKLMLLDEPASGLSRGERVALTDLLLELDPEHHADPHRARHGRRPARGRRASR